ncbi:MAG TPA: MutS family DNA mismatch repair protein, partial [Caldilineaceae bacterium]|nr:MutS family DNA mismatch repair protein [Caldilineaceae bacterium]
LQALCAPFTDTAVHPSEHVRRIARIAAATGVQGNPLLALLLNLLVPWGLYFAWQLAKEKAELRELLPTWLDCWTELEALSSLATFGVLNPQATFPALTNAGTQHSDPLFAVTALGHPLLPRAEVVRNDFAVAALGNVVILTGSNMSGKSTFLKALALNLCLAFTGGPVDAAHLVTPRLRLFTCIKVSDSVTDGISYFYAEVRRLKALLDALQQEDDLPLFYVVDEIFRGTNNRERLEGSRAYIRALAAQAGLGLVATHDLELVRLADEIPTIANYHFRDDIVDGRMHFDYQLRPGPSPTTNALKIMRHAGLPVE